MILAVKILRMPLSLGPPAMVKVAAEYLRQLKCTLDPAMVNGAVVMQIQHPLVLDLVVEKAVVPM